LSTGQKTLLAFLVFLSHQQGVTPGSDQGSRLVIFPPRPASFLPAKQGLPPDLPSRHHFLLLKINCSAGVSSHSANRFLTKIYHIFDQGLTSCKYLPAKRQACFRFTGQQHNWNTPFGKMKQSFGILLKACRSRSERRKSSQYPQGSFTLSVNVHTINPT
jgi:hypothetical protein